MIEIAAYTTMLIDHFARLFFPESTVLLILGRLSFPFFAWGISVGYQYTSSFYKYLMRIVILAIVSQLPYSLLFRNGYLNICFTFAVSLIVLKIYNSKIYTIHKFIAIFTLLIISHIFKLEYGAYCICTILIFNMSKSNDYLAFRQSFATFVFILICRYDPIQIFSCISFFIIFILHKRDFKINKKVKYVFYPGHLFLLWVIILLQGG